MKAIGELKRGQIFWLDDCPPLEGHVAKRRPVIIISPADRLKTEVLVLVVATSTTALASEADRVALPSMEDEPQSKARLPKKSWAVPRWHLMVDRERLREGAGYIHGALLRRVVDAVLKRLGE